MFSYRHGFHAGNHADVLKHCVLVHLLRHLAQKDKAFWCIDTHAGAASYDLRGEYARKSAESATGIREGARTGLASMMTALLFAVSLFFIPLLEPLQKLHYAYAPALVAVGLLMTGSFARIDFDDLTELVPAFVTITFMVFTYNIGNGLTAGLLVYPIVKGAAGRIREVEPGALVLALLSLSYYVFGLPH